MKHTSTCPACLPVCLPGRLCMSAGDAAPASAVYAAEAASMAYRDVQLIQLIARHVHKWLPQLHALFLALLCCRADRTGGCR
jgi:hypothetical protein